MSTNLTGVIVVTFSVLYSGCPSNRPDYSGFLDNCSGFVKAPEGRDSWVQRSAGRRLPVLKKYNRVMIDPVVIWYNKDSHYKGIHPEVVARLANDFHQAAIVALQDRYPLVLEPGPDVLRIRAAITDVVATKPALNTATFVGPGRQVSMLSKLTTGKHLFVGEASIEVEFLDSQTNERLFAYIDKRIGNKINPVQAVTKWGHVDAAFDHWAKKLRRRLDEAHANG
jgi:hypothetical protein